MSKPKNRTNEKCHKERLMKRAAGGVVPIRLFNLACDSFMRSRGLETEVSISMMEAL